MELSFSGIREIRAISIQPTVSKKTQLIERSLDFSLLLGVVSQHHPTLVSRRSSWHFLLWENPL